MTRTIGIIGDGPAAYIAAHAVASAGDVPVLYGPGHSTSRPPLLGARYLLHDIAGLDAPSMPFKVDLSWYDPSRHMKKATQDEACRDDVPQLDRELIEVGLKISPRAKAWDLRVIFWSLLAHYNDVTVRTDGMTGETFDQLRRYAPQVDAWITTTPLCIGNHTYSAVPIWQGYGHPGATQDVSTARFASGDQVSWISDVQVFGRTIEWPEYDNRSRPPFASLLVERPLFTNCTCHRDVLRVDQACWNAEDTISDVWSRVTALLAGEIKADEGLLHNNPNCPYANDAISDEVASQLGCRCG